MSSKCTFPIRRGAAARPAPPTCVAGNPVNWTAEIMEANDYYPFGQVMPSRTYALTGAKKTRFGFNGKEKDAEVGGDDYDFGARMYDARIARWMSLDPMQREYPFLSPYNFCANSPLQSIDPDGKNIKYYVVTDKNGDKTLHVTVYAKLLNQSSDQMIDLNGVKSAAEQDASTFNGSFTDPVSGKNIKVVFELKITIIQDESQIQKDDHVINIVDGIKSDDLATPLGITTRSGNIQCIDKNLNFAEYGKTICHEIGHDLGLADGYETDKSGRVSKCNGNNLMGCIDQNLGLDLTENQRRTAFYKFVAFDSKLPKAEQGRTHNVRNGNAHPTGDSRTDNRNFVDRVKQ